MTTRQGAESNQDTLRGVPDRDDVRATTSGGRALRTLSPEECFELIEEGGVGRVGFTAADGVMILPVNFAVTEKKIVFRTAPDTLLALHADAQVSFEVDRLDEARCEGWSVLLHGHAHKVREEREVKHLEGSTHLEPWAGGARDVYVRVTPVRITGRRVQSGWPGPDAGM